jgi:hypothetical protein
MSYANEFRIKPGSKVNLAKIDPGYDGGYANEAAIKDELINTANA